MCLNVLVLTGAPPSLTAINPRQDESPLPGDMPQGEKENEHRSPEDGSVQEKAWNTEVKGVGDRFLVLSSVRQGVQWLPGVSQYLATRKGRSRVSLFSSFL